MAIIPAADLAAWRKFSITAQRFVAIVQGAANKFVHKAA